MLSLLHTLINYILHLDQHIAIFMHLWGNWAYLALFTIIFCQTAIIFAALLPGDSLLFATGALAALSPDSLNIYLLLTLLSTAAVLGNTANYFIGRWAGPKVFQDNSRFLNRKHLTRAHAFCERHGSRAIIIGLFIPIVRTFVPFVAGVGYMTPWRFFTANLAGVALWMGTLLYGSYLFGNIPPVKEHFSLVILAIIGISLLPPLIGFLRQTIMRISTANSR